MNSVKRINITPTKFGNKTIPGPRVPLEKLSRNYSRRLSHILHQDVTPSPVTPKTKIRKKKRHSDRVTENLNNGARNLF